MRAMNVERRLPNMLGSVSEEKVRQMPPKPFMDSARNISGDRTLVFQEARAMREQDAAKQALPISRVGRGPKRSMRTPSGRVVALSMKEPMVKPRLSISSCWLQLGHPCGSSWVVLVVFSAEHMLE